MRSIIGALVLGLVVVGGCDNKAPVKEAANTQPEKTSTGAQEAGSTLKTVALTPDNTKIQFVGKHPDDKPNRVGGFKKFAGKAEISMVEHMNSDHAKAIAHYVDLAGLPKTVPAQMAGIDTEGMHLRIGQALYWLPFQAPCHTPIQVREALVSLAHAEVWPKNAVADA